VGCSRTDGFASMRSGEDGFLLLGAIVAIFLVLLILSVAAPTVARQLRREREVEAVHRGNQYVRAIQMYYKKFQHYPGSLEQLEKSNNIRFLRQKYVDPMTGKADWRLIHVGEQKTTVKGFFGQPLAGIASQGVGGASGLSSSGSMGSPAGSSPSAFGTPGVGGPGLGSSSGGSGGGLGGTGQGGSGGPSLGATGGTASLGGTGSSGVASQSATSFGGSGGPFLGIGSSAGGSSIVVLNEQTTYPTWEFIYDPRIEQRKARVNLLGGGMTTSGASGLGGASGSNSGVGGGLTPGSSPAPSSATPPPSPPR